MGALPTHTEVKAIRGDIDRYIDDAVDAKTLDDYITQALNELQIDLYNKRQLAWKQVYNGDITTGIYADQQYYPDGMTETQIKRMISLKTVYLVISDFAVIANEKDGQWWGLSHAYRNDYEALLNDCKLATFIFSEQTTSVPAQAFLRQ